MLSIFYIVMFVVYIVDLVALYFLCSCVLLQSVVYVIVSDCSVLDVVVFVSPVLSM